MNNFQAGDRVYHTAEVDSLGTVLNLLPEGSVEVSWDDIGRRSYRPDLLRHVGSAPWGGAAASQPTEDMVNEPSHYSKGMPEGVQVIDIIEAQQAVGGQNNHSQAIKYLLRALLKDNTVQDYRKAVWYLNREIESLEDK